MVTTGYIGLPTYKNVNMHVIIYGIFISQFLLYVHTLVHVHDIIINKDIGKKQSTGSLFYLLDFLPQLLFLTAITTATEIPQECCETGA